MKFRDPVTGEMITIPIEFCPKCWLADLKAQLMFDKRLPGKDSGDRVERWLCIVCSHSQLRVVDEWWDA